MLGLSEVPSAERHWGRPSSSAFEAGFEDELVEVRSPAKEEAAALGLTRLTGPVGRMGRMRQAEVGRVEERLEMMAVRWAGLRTEQKVVLPLVRSIEFEAAS